jgi:hypothetical protein
MGKMSVTLLWFSTMCSSCVVISYIHYIHPDSVKKERRPASSQSWVLSPAVITWEDTEILRDDCTNLPSYTRPSL